MFSFFIIFKSLCNVNDYIYKKLKKIIVRLDITTKTCYTLVVIDEVTTKKDE